MKRLTLNLLIGLLLLTICSFSQTTHTLKGRVVDADSYAPLANALVSLQNTTLESVTDVEGYFVIENVPTGIVHIELRLVNYVSQTFPVHIDEREILDLGDIYLSEDFSLLEQQIGIISLTEDDLNDNDIQSENTVGLLQSSRDIFQNRAAFDFSQSFFRIRGYDSQNALVLMNGIPMNKLYDGRPQWNNWGGLNDVTRHQEFISGLSPSELTFGGILGSTNISTRPSVYRPGLKLSSSFSNRTYMGRFMATYNSGLQNDIISYSISASRRWANEGFVKGSIYDAFSLFASLELRLNDKNSLLATALFSPNKRGGVSAITEREFNLMGRDYNPYWGKQQGSIRNARMRDISEPLVMLSHFMETENSKLTTSFAYQFGRQARSRLDYINAPNPYPNYWRYLPAINEKPQIDWNQLYDANKVELNIPDLGAARYLLYEDRTDDDLLTISSVFNTKVAKHLFLDIGATYKSLFSENYATPTDLLGATFYNDVNPFTLINGAASQNDMLGELTKGVGDRIKYNFNTIANEYRGFTQLRFEYPKADLFIGGSYTLSDYQREGLFQNESFEDNSLGKSDQLTFENYGLKGGFLYKITGRHLLSVNGTYLTRAPVIRNAFVNSRENNTVVDGLQSEEVLSGEANYIYRSSDIKTRVTGYYTKFTKGTDINYFFAQGGSGTDFFQEVVTGIEKIHLGGELGFEYQASPTVKMSFVAAYGKHYYSNDPNIRVNFDTAGYNEDLINTIGFKDLGASHINNLRISNGPQQAYSIGIEYRDPNYWWIGATANYLAEAFIDVSTITRTDDFFIDPESIDGLTFEDINYELADQLLKQEKFEPYYLLNLTGGKSWRFKDSYLGIFVSINNAFDETFKTGGYEQSRTANYRDMVEDTANGENNRNFGNKYWFGFGRTYFLNIAYSF